MINDITITMMDVHLVLLGIHADQNTNTDVMIDARRLMQAKNLTAMKYPEMKYCVVNACIYFGIFLFT